MEPILFCLSHVYSQLRYRWPGVPDIGQCDRKLTESFFHDADLFSFSLEDWKSAVGFLCSHAPELLPWLAPWCRNGDTNGEHLCANIHQLLRVVQSEGAHYITYDHSSYPEALRFIPDPPLAITLTGDLKNIKKPSVSVIGSRKASVLALRESFALAKQLGAHGFQIVSGGAFGCDIAAHQGALALHINPAPTVSVAAGGLSRLYPAHNQRIFDGIREQGGIFLSERLWWEGCRPHDFAARNRIISGMSFATCVMQAGMKSGALLTAKHSLNHGREVLVLRHPSDDVRADGSRWLENDGAEAFSSAEEIGMSLIGMLANNSH